MIDLIAIRTRDADYNDVFEAQESMSKGIAHRLVAWPVADRRDLLGYVDVLAAENAELKAQLAESKLMLQEAQAYGKAQQKWAHEWRDKCDALLAAERRLAAENAALRKDAERYRWLRIPENGVSVTIADEDDPETWYEYDSLRLDAAIDAAMEQSHDK